MRRLFLLFQVICVLLFVGALYQFAMSRYEEYRFPPTGKLIDVGGYKLHMHCRGSGSPTVILEAGMGANSLEWSLVQPEVVKFSRVCRYDRAGYGWSEKSSKPRTSANIVEELHTLLIKGEISGPYILVGHSFGGINVRLFEKRFPNEVVGMVLVDSSHEDQFEKMGWNTEDKRSFVAKFLGGSFFIAFKDFTGITRLQRQFETPPDRYGQFDEETKIGYFAKQGSMISILALNDESENFVTSMKQIKEVSGSIGNKPLIVITAGIYDFIGEPGLSAKKIAEKKRTWNLLQLDLVSKSTTGKQIVATKSGHGITRYQPEIIVSAIKDVRDQILKQL